MANPISEGIGIMSHGDNPVCRMYKKVIGRDSEKGILKRNKGKEQVLKIDKVMFG